MKGPVQYTSIGGQAVIEGVMMRSPHFLAVAVRRPDRRIIIRHSPYSSITQRFPWLKRPVFRGVVMLVESMFQGIEALTYSAGIASENEKSEEQLSAGAIVFSVLAAFAVGMGLFVALPHVLTVLLASNQSLRLSADSPLFHLIDGVLKMVILLAYVYLIALMKDIHRVFQYHGAEHKAIATFEAGEDLNVDNARKYSRLHPRCGTSFLLFLVLISILVFSVVIPALGFTGMTTNPVLNHGFMIVAKVLLMLPVAGLAYEFIKMCACRMHRPVFRAMIWPGLVLQRLTTREPGDDQLEVALASLKQVLRLEKTEQEVFKNWEHEFEISHLAELGRVQAWVTEFPET